jgi:HD-GYP domain-containing protein (c-di-GMP phosphodiesterase class II)
MLSVLAREAGVALENISKLQESQRTIMDLLKGLARYLDAKAPYLIGHSERVARLSQVIGEEMGLQPEELQRLYLEGLLHDLGNVGVDDELFLRTSKLTEEEMGRVRQHASIGAEILRDVTALRHLMAGPLYHHERYDGNGYPQGLKGEQIPAHARIVGVAEAFDALRSSRPYREAFSVAETISQLKESVGTMFDPRVVAAIISAFQRGKIHG